MDEKYFKLEKSKSFAYVFSVNGKEIVPNAGAGLASIRQIAFEVMHTLKDEFPELPNRIYMCPDPDQISGLDTVYFLLVKQKDPNSSTVED